MEVLVLPGDAEQPDGPEVVRKRASLPGERERLLREADVLRTAAACGLPGFPALLTPPSPDVAEPCMVTSAAAGPSLATAAPLPIVEVAGVAGEVARLLAGLHEAGLVHGAVEPSHVVLDGCGGAILVGLGAGGRAGSPPPDPAQGPLDPTGDVAGWGMLVGHLLDWSAVGDEDSLVALRQALTTRRARRTRGLPQARPDEQARRVLAALAEQAQDPDPARRPAARSLAAAIAHRIPAARIPGAVTVVPPGSATAPRRGGGLLDRLAAHRTAAPPPPAPEGSGPEDPSRTAGSPRTTGSSPRATTAPLVGTAPPAGTAPRAGTSGPPAARQVKAARGRRGPTRLQVPLASAPLLVPAGTRSSSAAAGPADDEAGPGAAPSGGRHEGWTQAVRRRVASRGRWTVVAAVAAVAVVAATVAVAGLRTGPKEGPRAVSRTPLPGCAPAAPPAADVDGDGCEEPVRWLDGVLEAGSARFALGAPGDAWALGDWDCDGRRTPALLHQGTLSVFDAWPAANGVLHGRQVAAEAGASSVVAVAAPDGCERPSLRRPGAADVVVDARRKP